MLPEASHAGRVESTQQVTQLQVQGVARVDHHGQRVMGGFPGNHLAELHAAAAAQGAVHRVVLEHQHAVEQRPATLPGPALDIEQRRVLMLAHRQVQRLQFTQPVPQQALRPGRLNDRQGIDEQPQHPLGIGQRRRTPGHGGAESHAALPAVALQQQAPGSLEQGVQGHPLAPGKCPQRRGHLGVQLQTQIAMPGPGRYWRQGIGQQRRLLQLTQLLAPELLAQRAILTAQPGQVIAVAAGARSGRLTAVMQQHFFDQAGRGPAVEQDVMAGPDQVVSAFAQTHQQHPLQRRSAQVKALIALGIGQFGQFQARLFGAACTPVEVAHRRSQLAMDPLQGLGQVAFPGETGPQDRVLIADLLPGCGETRAINIVQWHTDLIDIGTARDALHSVKQHALLQRRQGVKVFEVGGGHRQCIQLRLADARQREIRRCDTRSAGAQAMVDQSAQARQVVLGQPLHQLAVEALAAIAPAQLQAAVAHLTGDYPFAVGIGARVQGRAQAFPGPVEQAVGQAARVELPQVVEGDLRCRAGRQPAGQIILAQVAQHAVAQALAGYLAHLLLDRLDRFGR